MLRDGDTYIDNVLCNKMMGHCPSFDIGNVCFVIGNVCFVETYNK